MRAAQLPPAVGSSGWFGIRIQPSDSLWASSDFMCPDIPLDVFSRGVAESAEKKHTIPRLPKSFSPLCVSAPPRDTFFGPLKPNAVPVRRGLLAVAWNGWFGARQHPAPAHRAAALQC